MGHEGKRLTEWSDADLAQAEIVCHTQDAIGQMVRSKLLHKDVIVDSWGPSINGTRPITTPLVNWYREEWDAPETWAD